MCNQITGVMFVNLQNYSQKTHNSLFHIAETSFRFKTALQFNIWKQLINIKNSDTSKSQEWNTMVEILSSAFQRRCWHPLIITTKAWDDNENKVYNLVRGWGSHILSLAPNQCPGHRME